MHNFNYNMLNLFEMKVFFYFVYIYFEKYLATKYKLELFLF